MTQQEKLTRALKQCEEQLDALGIHYGDVSEIVVNTRAKKRYGQCRRRNGGYEINISAVLLDDRVPDVTLRPTVMHELLHTCQGCMNHGAVWKGLAAKVNQTYGYNVKRASSAEERGIADVVKENNQPKYVFVCENCGMEIHRYRKSNFTRNYTRYRCGKCKGHLIRKL